MKKKTNRFLWAGGIVLLLVIAIGAGLLWAGSAAKPMPEALEALESDVKVNVEANSWIVFTPKDDAPKTGIVFYPGGKVDPRAYAPAAYQIASQGYLVVIPPMPLNLAVFAPDRAKDIIAAYPEIECWIVGGHSLGGVMAAQFSNEAGSGVSGLLLWASYPADSLDLSASELQVLTISASEDGLTTQDEVEASLTRLPPTTEWTIIDGGNHAGFGWYGEQSGDGTASITRQEQQEQIVQVTVNWLESAGICE